jgi:hypothetical protein
MNYQKGQKKNMKISARMLAFSALIAIILIAFGAQLWELAESKMSKNPPPPPLPLAVQRTPTPRPPGAPDDFWNLCPILRQTIKDAGVTSYGGMGIPTTNKKEWYIKIENWNESEQVRHAICQNKEAVRRVYKIGIRNFSIVREGSRSETDRLTLDVPLTPHRCKKM